MLKVKEAEDELYRLWLGWDGNEDKYAQDFGFTFYCWVRRNHPELQLFRCKDKVYKINNWLNEWQNLRNL